MLNNATDPASLYRAATDRAMTVVDAVRTDQLGSPTPCTEWTVQQLIDHLVGPAVQVGDDAPPQDRLLAAMGRHL